MEKSKIEIVCSKDACAECLLPLINYIKNLGYHGHTFDIVVDPDIDENRKVFEFDGDGNHIIMSIKVNDEEVKEKCKKKKKLVIGK